MQFHIPQYIEIEDKLFGPLTLKQAIYVAGGVGASYLVYKIFVSYIFIAAPLIAAIAALTWALAFYPQEKLGRPFIEVLEAGLGYFLKDKLYTWKKSSPQIKTETEEAFTAYTPSATPSVPTGKLSSTSLDLGIKSARRDDADEARKTGMMTKL